MLKFNRKFVKKAKRRLETARMAFSKGYVCSACSNCYYALFNLMQSVVGDPPDGSWSHGGLPKAFTKKVFQEQILPTNEIKGFVALCDSLYAFRRESDYYDSILEHSENAKRDIEGYIAKVERLLNLLEEK